MNAFEESIQPNPFLKALLLDAVENQVRDKTPPEAGEALVRWKAAGLSEEQAKERIAAVMLKYLCTTLHDGVPFDGESYAQDLKQLT